MPNIEQMLQTMREQAIPEDTICQFALPKTKKAKATDVLGFVNQMDALLSKEQRLAVMEEQGCCKHSTKAEPFRLFGEKHADKTLAEKIALLHELDSCHKASCRLNTDGTVSIYWGVAGYYDCPCSLVNKLKTSVIPLTFCGCCAGHARYTHQFALGVKLQLKDIVSSMANSNGEKHCEFLFEIVKE